MKSLHRVRLVFDRRELIRLAARQHPRRALDAGYLLHVGLAALFAGRPPLSTFAEVDPGEGSAGESGGELVFVVAYAVMDEAGLQAAMAPEHRGLVRACSTLPMPVLAPGTRLAFRVRACPVVRTKNAGDHERAQDGKGRQRSREVDAWLAHRFPTWKPEPDRTGTSFERAGREWMERQQVYGQWLSRQLTANAAVAVDGDPTLEAFQREKLFRRGDKRAGARPLLERPAALLSGTVVVGEPSAFTALLTRGVGRHRAFGFGMLRVRPA